MPAKILAPRRVIIAVAITLLLGSASVLALGATGDQPLDDVPATWGVAAPRIGDRGNYTYALVDEATGRPIGRETPYLDFEQEPARLELDVDGRPVVVNTLSAAYGAYRDVDGGERPSQYVWTMDAAWQVVQAADGSLPFLELDASNWLGFMQGTDSTSTDVAGIPVTTSTSDTTASLVMRSFPGGSLNVTAMASHLSFCGARSALQGAEAPVRDGLVLFDRCTFRFGGVNTLKDPVTWVEAEGPFDDEGYDAPDALVEPLGDGTRFTALGRQRLGELDTLVFAMQTPDVHVWMARDVPYPVQMSVREGDQVHVLRLTTFVRGSEPLGTDLAGRAPAPAATLAASHPWGLDDTDSPLAVRASDAWQAALDDGPLADYLAAHPKAFTYDLEGSASQNQVSGLEQYSWTFQLTDGVSRFFVEVRAEVQLLVPAPPMLELPMTPPKREPTFSFDYQERVTGEAPPLDASWFPARLPTATSLLARWQSYIGETRPFATWGHRVVCGYEDDTSVVGSCESHRLEILAGGQFTALEVDATSTPGEPRLEGSIAILSSSFDETGRVVDLLALRADQTTVYAPTSLVPSNAAEPYGDAPSVGPGWSLPGFATVASVGLFALLAGLAYLLWPVVKGGAFAGYARVTGQELLEHPQRQKLLTCIEAQPGIHLKELARQTGMAWGQTQHHMAKLVAAGAIVAKPLGGYTCYFPKGQDRSTMGAAGVLKADGARRLFATIAGTQGLSVGQLSRAAGLTESTAHYHLKRLQAAGLVSTHLIDGARRVTLTAMGAEAGKRFGGASAAAQAA